MVWIEGSLYCDGCGVEITWSPVTFGDEHYCCQMCLEGEECGCGAHEEDEERRNETSPSAPTSYA